MNAKTKKHDSGKRTLQLGYGTKVQYPNSTIFRHTVSRAVLACANPPVRLVE